MRRCHNAVRSFPARGQGRAIRPPRRFSWRAEAGAFRGWRIEFPGFFSWCGTRETQVPDNDGNPGESLAEPVPDALLLPISFLRKISFRSPRNASFCFRGSPPSPCPDNVHSDRMNVKVHCRKRRPFRPPGLEPFAVHPSAPATAALNRSRTGWPQASPRCAAGMTIRVFLRLNSAIQAQKNRPRGRLDQNGGGRWHVRMD